MPKPWGRVSRTEMDVRPGGIFSIDIATADGQESPNLGCFLEVIPMERLVWTSMLFPGYRPAVFDDIPITAIVTMETVGTGTRYVFTALHRDEADLEKNKASGFDAGHRDRRRSVRGARDRDEVVLGDHPNRGRNCSSQSRNLVTGVSDLTPRAGSGRAARGGGVGGAVNQEAGQSNLC